jgi:predicted AlkP superfamily pyrophosphatase or phosphodiesterase
MLIKEEVMLRRPKFSGNERAKHVIVISIDALSETEWDIVNRLPNLSNLIRSGSYSYSLKSVFPTHTYVVHTTIVTGVHPDKHGILHNHQLQPFVPDSQQTWHWYQSEIKAPTIYDLARKHGMTTAGLLWPVSGKSSIKYNFPEILAIKGENQTLKVLRNGTLPFLIDLELRLGKYRKSTKQPDFDDYITLCAVDTINRKKPNLTLIHLVDLDDTKHRYRTDGREVEEALVRLDIRVGEIIQATRDAGIYEDTVFLVLGDHGQFSVDYNIHLNNLLRDAGLIYEEGSELKWHAYLQSTGGNAYLHIKNNDKETEKVALALLRKAMNEDIYGIEDIYDRADLDALHAHQDIKYVVEAKPGYHFHDELSPVTIENYVEQGKKYATHGYSPEKNNYKCIFITAGNNIRKNFNIGPIEMVDIAPTIADILDMRFYECDGQSLFHMFE